MKEPTGIVVPMDFTDCRVTTPEPDADWERAIAKGGPGVGLSPQMPGFEDSLTAEQIAGFVSHIRTFCKDTRWPSGNNNFPRPINVLTSASDCFANIVIGQNKNDLFPSLAQSKQ